MKIVVHSILKKNEQIRHYTTGKRVVYRPPARLFQVLNRRFNLLEATNMRYFRPTALLIVI